MLKFVASAYEVTVHITLWLNLVGCAIAGAIIGGHVSVEYGILGFIAGAAVGIVSNIIFGGISVIFVNMSKDITGLKSYVRGIESDLRDRT